MKVSDFNYDLPQELIAQVPIKNRDESRLMVLDRKSKTIDHKIFKDILDYLKPGDCLVRNNTKVIPARLYGIKEETGINVEFLLLNRIEGDYWEVMVKPGRRLKKGTNVIFGNGLLKAEILDIMEGGNRKVKVVFRHLIVAGQMAKMGHFLTLSVHIHNAVDIGSSQFIIIGDLHKLLGRVNKEHLVILLALAQHHDAGGNGGAVKEVRRQLNDAIHKVVIH